MLQPYVLVVVAISHGLKEGSVPSTWVLGTHRRLAKPYRKNVSVRRLGLLWWGRFGLTFAWQAPEWAKMMPPARPPSVIGS